MDRKVRPEFETTGRLCVYQKFISAMIFILVFY